MAAIVITGARLTAAAQDVFDGWLNDVAKPGLDYEAILDECQQTMRDRLMTLSPLVYELPGSLTYSGKPSFFYLDAHQLDIETRRVPPITTEVDVYDCPIQARTEP